MAAPPESLWARRFDALPRTPAQAASEAAGTLRLSDDLFVVRIPGEANVVAQTGADGVLLVDGGSARRPTR